MKKEVGVDRVCQEMTHFRDTIDDLSLRDLGYIGVWYTWERGNSPSICIRERLDRFILFAPRLGCTTSNPIPWWNIHCSISLITLQ